MEPVTVDLARWDGPHHDPLCAAQHRAEERPRARPRCTVSSRSGKRAAGPHGRAASRSRAGPGDEQRPSQRPASGLVGAGDEAGAELAIELKELPAGASSHGREDSAALSRRPAVVTLSLLLDRRGLRLARGRFGSGLWLRLRLGLDRRLRLGAAAPPQPRPPAREPRRPPGVELFVDLRALWRHRAHEQLRLGQRDPPLRTHACALAHLAAQVVELGAVTSPIAITSMRSILGECTGNVRRRRRRTTACAP